MRGATRQRAIFKIVNNQNPFNMYLLTISSYSSSQTFEFNNLRQALNSFIEHCDSFGYEYSEDNDGNFTAGGYGHSHEIILTSNF